MIKKNDHNEKIKILPANVQHFLTVFLCSLLLLFGFCSIATAQQSYSIADSGNVISNPAFKACHAASIAELGKDTLLYAWFAGDYEGAANVCIWACFRYTQQREQWGEPFIIAAALDSMQQKIACWNPVLFKTKSGTILLDYKTGKNPREWVAMRKTSNDNGRSWTKEQYLPNHFLGPIKNKPVQLANGDILYGSSVESTDMKRWQVHAEISNEAGTAWRFIQIDCDTFDVIQPTIIQYASGILQMLCRSRQNMIVETWSYNNGQSWTKARATGLPNPNAGIDAARAANGNIILVYNPLQAGNNWWNGRNILRVAESADGKNWKDVVTLQNEPKGEYSYPAIITDSRNIIRIAYTDNRSNIKYADIIMH